MGGWRGLLLGDGGRGAASRTLLLVGLMALAAGCDQGSGQRAPAGRRAAADPPEITTTSLPSGVERQPYDVTLEASGDGPVGFEVVEGAPPWGLILEEGGRLHGAPTFAGSFELTVRARGPGGEGSRRLRVDVAPWQAVGALACGGSASVTLTASARSAHTGLDLDRPGAAAFLSLPIAEDVAAVELSVEGSGGDPILLLPRAPYGAGSARIYGYTLIEDHPGPEALRLTDGTPDYGLFNYSAALAVPITVAADGPGTFTVSARCVQGVALGPASLPVATLGAPYWAGVFAWRGVAPVAFSAEDLPQGLSLDAQTGVLSGIPVEAGVSQLRVSVVDGAGARDTLDIPLWVAEPLPAACGDVLAGSLERRAFDGAQGLATAEGVTVYAVEWTSAASSVAIEGRWMGETGSLGVWLGRPGSPASSSALADWLDVRYATDLPARHALSPETVPALGEYGGTAIVAVAAVGAPGDYELEVACDDALAVETRFLPHGVAGEPYEAALGARGAAGGELSWGIPEGQLPEGVTLEGGTLRGTPQGVGLATFTVEATSTGGASARRALSLDVGVDACGSAERLACGDFVYESLTAQAWADRVSLDLTVPGAARFYCLPPGGAGEVTLTLSPVSGSDPDLLIGGPGMPPGVDDARAYAAWSTLDAVDRLTLSAASYPSLASFGGAPVGVAVAMQRPGGYTLEVECR